MKVQSASVRRSAVVVLAMLAFAAMPASPAAGAVTARTASVSDWRGDATMLSGETRISRGELIHDDWLYDDYGANLDGGPNTPAFRAALAPTRGDYRYPTNANRYGYNAADLRQLRVAADGAGLHIVAFLQTMKDRDAPIVTLGDRQRARPRRGRLARRCRDRRPRRRHFVTFSGSFAAVTDSRGRRERLRQPGVNMAENAIEVDVPWRNLPATRGRTVTLYVVSGLLDPQARRLQPGSGGPAHRHGARRRPARLDRRLRRGFDPDEEFSRAIGSHWGEERQSASLAGRDVSELGHTVDLSELEGRVTDAYTPASGRFYNRIFRSTQDFGEGITLKNPSGGNAGGSPDPQFLSPHQPYGLYLPRRLRAGTTRAAAPQRPLAGREPQRVPGRVAEPVQPARRRAVEHRDHPARPRDGHVVHRRRVQGRARGMGGRARPLHRGRRAHAHHAATRWAAT